MAQIESILGDQTDSPTNKQNVTEFNSQSKNTPSSKETNSSNPSTGTATATARGLMDQAKETASQAYDAVTDKAAIKLDQQKSTLTEGITTVADSVRKVGENLGSSSAESGLAEAAAKYTNTAAQKLEDVAGYFENRNLREMARDLEGFARRNPAVFLGAAFGLGFIAARFLKSTNPKIDTARAGRAFTASPRTREANIGNTPAF